MSKLDNPAILGGEKAVTLDETEANRYPIITEEDEQAVLEVLRSGNLSFHPATRELENDYRERFGVRHALAHCNGTAALMASFLALDLQPGDEVIVPSATFWASVTPMLWLGAIPVFAESETERLGLDPDDVRSKITPRTKAIVVVHLFGLPSKMTELFEIARQHNLKIIEDASHAHGAIWRGRPCGTLGDVSVFSLQTDKLAPAGEGGILLTNDDEIYERAVCLGDMMRMIELPTETRYLAATTFGLKTRMASLSAAVGRVQLKRLDEHNQKRKENIVYLSEKLEKLGFHTFLEPEHLSRVYFEFLIRYDAEINGMPIDILIEALKAEGCNVATPRYPLLHQQPFFTHGLWKKVARLPEVPAKDLPEYKVDALPKIEAENQKLIKLPNFPLADRDLLDQYALAFEKVLSHTTEIMTQAKAAD
ncbi:MAG: DegT/DnrJ/EryC1/StrS family aminotransferase [Pyrinomonadaceae bacterium]|nr:DegT/DnrJ/EryC1/StrS family aminotransferase [Pyrinomonadaceae bacterium]